MCCTFSWAEFWFTSWSEAAKGLNPAQRLTDLFPWRTCLVAGSAVAYLHTFHLCFSAQSRPWAQPGWGAPQRTWSQWTSPGWKSRSADLPQLRTKTAKRQRAQAWTSHTGVLEYDSPLKRSSYNFIFDWKQKNMMDSSLRGCSHVVFDSHSL